MTIDHSRERDRSRFWLTARPSSLRMRPDGGVDYDWESGPNDGYGFGGGPVRTVGAPTARYLLTIAQHREAVRDFLSDINPETGYLD